MSILPSNLLAVAQSLLPKDLLRSILAAPTDAAIAEACAHLEAIHAGILPFVPEPVLDVLALDPSNARIVGSQLRGTLVIVKLVGYTQLLAELAQQGRQGSETAGLILRTVFSSLADHVVQHGGGLIKFGGDSLTAIFETTRLGSQHAALGAAAALGMQRAINTGSVPESVSRLQLRIAIHSGSFFVTEAGDTSHHELLVTGEAAHKTAQLCDNAPSGQIVVSPETLRLLHAARFVDQQNTQRVLVGLTQVPTLPTARSTWQPLAPSAPALVELLQRIARLQPFLLHNLPQRFAQRNAAVGEFRPVTVVVSSFQAFRRLLDFLEMAATLEQDVSIIGQLVDTNFTWTQAILQRYGGSINAIEMAPTGDRMIALFGAPIAHEDDPQRAVEAMLALQAGADEIQQRVLQLVTAWATAHPQQLPLLRLARELPRQHAGIATGTVFAGLIGSNQRHEYNVIGETVTLAARLTSTAGAGNILLAARTYQSAQQQILAEPLAPLSLKDFAQPVPVYRALAMRAGASDRSDTLVAAPLVGRAAPYALLSQRASEALADDGHARVVSVVGDPGIGKTRLLDELWQQLATTHPHVRILREACQSFDQTTPYALVSQLISQILPIDPHMNRETQAESIQQQLDTLVPEWSRFAPLLGPIINLPFAETDLTKVLAPEQRRDRLHDLVVAMLLALAGRQPLAIALDDLHWVDQSSLQLLQQLSAELGSQSLLLIFGYRPASDFTPTWTDQANATTIQLQELDQSASAALLRELLAAEPPPELLPLLERTQGIPLFLEEIVRYLVNTGILQRNDHGAWQVAGLLDDTAIPLEIEQLIAARLDWLAEPTRAVAQIASVVGQQFDKRLIGALADGEWTEHFDELRRTDVVFQANSTTYAFKHAIVRDVVYDGISFARRRELHGMVASTIEHIYAAELGAHRVVMAQHYLRAEQHDRAFPHFLAAAHEAQARYANHEAIKLYTQALYTTPWYGHDNAVPDLARAAPLYQGLGDVLALTGSYGGARDYYGALVEMIDTQAATDMYVLKAALQRKIGSTLENQGNFDTALQRLQSAAATIQQASPDESSFEYAHILSDIGWVYFRQNDMVQAQLYLEQALNQLEEEEITPETARIYNRLGGIAWQRGDLATAQRYVEQSLEATEETGDLVGQAWALNNLALLTESQGQNVESILHSRYAIEIMERIGSKRMQAVALLNIGGALYNIGEYQQAHTNLVLAVERAQEVRDTYQQMRSLRRLSYVLSEMSEWESAEQVIQQSQLIASQLQLPTEQLDGYIALAEMFFQRNDLEAAASEFNNALQKVDENDRESEEYGRFQRLDAKLAFAQGNKTRAVELLHMAEALFTRLQNLPEANRTQKLLVAIEAQP